MTRNGRKINYTQLLLVQVNQYFTIDDIFYDLAYDYNAAIDCKITVYFLLKKVLKTTA